MRLLRRMWLWWATTVPGPMVQGRSITAVGWMWMRAAGLAASPEGGWSGAVAAVAASLRRGFEVFDRGEDFRARSPLDLSIDAREQRLFPAGVVPDHGEHFAALSFRETARGVEYFPSGIAAAVTRSLAWPRSTIRTPRHRAPAGSNTWCGWR